MRILGIFFLMLTAFAMIPMFLMGRRSNAGVLIYFGVVAFFYGVPGAAFIVLAVLLKQYKSWAVIVGLVLTSICALFALVGALGIAFNAANMPLPAVIIAASIMLLMLAAMGQLIYHLSKSFEAIRCATRPTQQGFEPIVGR